MKLTIIGTGNIGLVTALCFAEKGHQVYCVDIDQTKINKLKTGEASIFEPELDILLTNHVKKKNIQFTHQLDSIITQTDIIFLTVSTPNDSSGKIDLSAIDSALNDISRLCTTSIEIAKASTSKTIIIKSTVPPNTNNTLTEKYPYFKFISSPEFLREGSAIYDCLNPDRIIIGSQTSNSDEDLKLFKNIYSAFNLPDNKFIKMDSVTAEITKYAANIFLANRISLINEFSRVCEKSGGNIELLKLGLGLDHRIGTEFLNAGLGYGGSCFPKDIEAFTTFGVSLNENLLITKAIKETNDYQIQNFSDKIINYFKKNQSLLDEKTHIPTLCIWGASFKPETDDLREAPALKLIDHLLKNYFKLHIYDPKAGPQLTHIFKDHLNVKIYKNSYEALANADALVITTEWNEFKSSNLPEIKKHLKKPLVFDGRNIFDVTQMRDLEFEYFSIGRP